MLRTVGDAFEKTAALIGITVNPLARSEMKNVVRSSRFYSNDHTIQSYFEYDHYTGDHRLDVVEISYTHLGVTNEARSQ